MLWEACRILQLQPKLPVSNVIDVGILFVFCLIGVGMDTTLYSHELGSSRACS